MAAMEVTVVGEALVDLVGMPGTRTYAAHPGGSPANVAVALGRLGVPVTFRGRLGADAFGRMLREHLAANHVDLRHVVDAEEPSTLAVATVDAGGVATYDFWTAGTADWQWRDGELPDALPDTVGALHTGSLAAWLEPSAAAIAALLGRERDHGRITLSLDPNCRPRLMRSSEHSRKQVEQLVGRVDVVKASDADLHWLLPGMPPRQAAARWLELGPALVVVTLGDRGAYGLTRAASVEVPALKVDVVDTIGAGDAFTAGLLAGLRDADLLGATGRPALRRLGEEPLRDLLTGATLVAGLTCGRAGADSPTLADLQAREAI